jgi:hypothetical protein
VLRNGVVIATTVATFMLLEIRMVDIVLVLSVGVDRIRGGGFQIGGMDTGSRLVPAFWGKCGCTLEMWGVEIIGM